MFKRTKQKENKKKERKKGRRERKKGKEEGKEKKEERRKEAKETPLDVGHLRLLSGDLARVVLLGEHVVREVLVRRKVEQHLEPALCSTALAHTLRGHVGGLVDCD